MGDALLSLDTGEEGFIMPQLNLLGFLDLPWDALSFLEWMVGGLVGGRVELEEGREIELWLVCKKNKTLILKINGC